MTTHSMHPTIATLHDLVDGELSEAETRSVSAHLEACARCRESFDDLIQTVGEIGGLPTEAAVETELWSGIEERIRAAGTPVVPLHPLGDSPVEGQGGHAPGTPRSLDRGLEEPRRRSAALWAAGIALALFSGGVGWWLAPGGGPGTGPDLGVAPTDATLASDRMSAGFVGGEASMADAIGRLESLLEARGDELAPETRAVILENLEAIDAAIREAEMALADDPGNPTLHRMIAGHETARLRLLERAVSGFAGA